MTHRNKGSRKILRREITAASRRNCLDSAVILNQALQLCLVGAKFVRNNRDEIALRPLCVGNVRNTKVIGVRMRFPKVVSTALLFSCIAAIPAAHANLILNGSFESPIVPSSSLSCGVAFNTQCQGFYSHDQIGAPLAGPFDIGDWSVIGKGGAPGVAVVMQLGNGYTENSLRFDPQDGSQSLDLTGEGNQGANGIKQSVSTIVGTSYVLSFYLGRQDPLASGYEIGPSELDLILNQDAPINFINSNTFSNDVGWTQFSYEFTATTAFTTLAFLNATGVGNNFTGLDNVDLEAIPEPGTLALFGLGLSALVLLRRGKTRPRKFGQVSITRFVSSLRSF
jgi:hypothetical protein